MKINFITLFPSFYEVFKNESIIKNALSKKLVKIKVIDFRKYGIGKRKQVDDTVYGGGSGMLLRVEPLHQAIKQVSGKVILLSPQGKVFNQKIAMNLAKYSELNLIAGHYEGFDERIRDFIDLEISLGDYVLTGGELPSMVVADAVIRLLPKVIKAKSWKNDSFQNGLLDYPQYTKPRDYLGKQVPEVLLSGDHMKIAKWRKDKQIFKTKKQRQDLYKKYLERNKNAK